MTANRDRNWRFYTTFPSKKARVLKSLKLVVKFFLNSSRMYCDLPLPKFENRLGKARVLNPFGVLG